jgi:hypothetical protein
MYAPFKNEDGDFYGSFEVFEVWTRDDDHDVCDVDTLAFPGKGWYWWACFAGCLPDGEASGPFATKEAATEDALAQG